MYANFCNFDLFRLGLIAPIFFVSLIVKLNHSSNMSKTRASALSRVPNTEKQMKARGRRPSAFICFEVFGTRDKARSPSF